MLLPRWTRLTLLAWAAAAACAGAQAQAAPDPQEDDAGPARRWQVPPIRWTGFLAYDLRANRAPGEGSSLGHLVTGNLGLRSYIYQPWFARVSGNFGLTSSWTRDTHQRATLFDTDASLHETIRSREQFLTGSGRVDVFPQSRFPFEFHVERNDSRIDSGLASNFDFRNQGFGFSQRYRPPNGAWAVTGAYDHREQSGAGFRARQDTLNGDFATQWKFNDLNVGASHSRARTVGSGDDSRYGSLVVRHNYVPSTDFSLNSSGNWTRTEESSAGGASDLQVLQFSTVGMWRRARSPLSLTGSGRVLVLREDVGGNSLETVGATLGANYEYSPNLRLTGSGGVNVTHGADAQSTGFTGSVGATYQGDSLSILGARYDWFGSGSLGTALTQGSRIETERQTALNLQVGHTLTRTWNLAAGSALTVNGAQSLSWSRSHSTLAFARDFDQVTSLLNTASATWQAGSAGRSAYARASYSDSVQLAGRDDRFQMANFQLSGNFDFDNRRSLTGDLTLQRSWQTAGTVVDADGFASGGRVTSTGASGEISYRHNRPFGIPQLRFVSRLKLAQDVLKQPGTLPSLPDRETRLWENRLDYSIGRLDTQLVLRISEADGQRREALLFRVQRAFGD